LNKKYWDESDKFDAVFLCFGQNAQGLLPIDEFASIYESLISNIKSERGTPEVFLLIENAIKDNSYAQEIIKLADHYGINVIDTRVPFTKTGLSVEE
jgi:hypothetical protein